MTKTIKYKGEENLTKLIQKTGQLIDNNPLFEIESDIEEVVDAFIKIQDAINGEGDLTEKKGLFNAILSVVKKDKEFKYKSFESKIKSIFSQFDIISESVDNTIEAFSSYKKDLEKETNSLTAFIEGIEKEKEELDEKQARKLNDYKQLLSFLSINEERIGMSLSSAEDIGERMKSSRPIYEATLSACLLEVAAQKTISSANKIYTIMGSSIGDMDSSLTKNVAKTALLTASTTSKPLLNETQMNESVKLLSSTIEEIEKTKQSLLLNKG